MWRWAFGSSKRYGSDRGWVRAVPRSCRTGHSPHSFHTIVARKDMEQSGNNSFSRLMPCATAHRRHTNIIYLVANAINVFVTSVANDTILRRLVDLDINLAWIRNRNKGMTLMSVPCKRKTAMAEIIVWALEALVSETHDRVHAQITRGQVTRPIHVEEGGGCELLVELYGLGKGLEGVMGVTETGGAVAVLAEIIVGALLALPAGAADRVQANVAIDVAVDRFYRMAKRASERACLVNTLRCVTVPNAEGKVFHKIFF